MITIYNIITVYITIILEQLYMGAMHHVSNLSQNSNFTGQSKTVKS